MKLISGQTDFSLTECSAVAIGKFDGVHIGHVRLLDALKRAKEEDGLCPVVFTFDPSPEMFFSNGTARCLSTREEKRELLEKAGAEVLVEYPFRAETAAVPAEEFIDRYLSRQLKARKIVAGPDLSYGARGSGDFDLLLKKGAESGFTAEKIDKVLYHGTEISSTMIRQLIGQGLMEEAAACLGRPYSLCGEIVRGNRIGHRIGIPTINLVPDASKCLPPYGVYFSETVLDGKCYPSITNIGVKPTVSSGNAVAAETFLYDKVTELYGRKASVRLLSFHRPEQVYSSLDALRERMEKDLAAGRRAHGIL
jgi:riboflavin kinase/FMN adenylyltransferase